jgi:hypothetical protein
LMSEDALCMKLSVALPERMHVPTGKDYAAVNVRG